LRRSPLGSAASPAESNHLPYYTPSLLNYLRMAASAPTTTSEKRRRPRRGSLERPVSARIYRGAWALIALPLLITAFTVGRPDPLPPTPLPPSFDAGVASRVAQDLATNDPDRSPGGGDHDKAAALVANLLRQYNLNVREDWFSADIPGRGHQRLVNVIAQPAQPTAGQSTRSPRAIVVVADRDNIGVSPGLVDNGSGTGALIELARDLSTLSLAHTIVFVSTDGGAFGGLGTAQLARDPEFRANTLAVVNLDSISTTGAPRLILAGDGGRSPASVLAATADASVLEQAGSRAKTANGLYQLLDLAFPFSLYSQAPLLGAGVSALTLTSTGDRPISPASDGGLQLRASQIARLGMIGRAAQALILSLDGAGEVASGTSAYIYLGGRIVRGFALQLLLFFALVPALVATVDLWARLRRRGLGLAPALRSYRSRLGVWVWGGGLAALFTVAGAFPSGGNRPVAPDTVTAQQWPLAALAGLVVLTGAGWLLARVRLVPRVETERSDELAGHLIAMIALCCVAVAVCVINPFALVFVLPSLHVWLWVPHARDSRLGVRAALYAGGLAGPLLLVMVFAIRYELGFDAPWYIATLFTVGYAPVSLFLVILAWGAAAGQMAAILFGRYAPYPTQGERPERGVVRESIRLAVLVTRRARRHRARRPEAEAPPGQPRHDVFPEERPT